MVVSEEPRHDASIMERVSTWQAADDLILAIRFEADGTLTAAVKFCESKKGHSIMNKRH